ncbi:MAG: hypothetical protein L6246_01615 [Thermodesulfovibrionales bacterium]|nr:hypothetical protein [Nitrospinota bacterium]MCG2709005.1 hypothetical protein [Thermodesulfovibrionales bacterium]
MGSDLSKDMQLASTAGEEELKPLVYHKSSAVIAILINNNGNNENNEGHFPHFPRTRRKVPKRHSLHLIGRLGRLAEESESAEAEASQFVIALLLKQNFYYDKIADNAQICFYGTIRKVLFKAP